MKKTDDLNELRNEFSIEYRGGAKYFTGTVGKFFLTTEIFEIIKGWHSREIEDSEFKDATVQTLIQRYKKDVDMSHEMGEATSETLVQRELGNLWFSKTDFYLTGYKFYFKGKDKIIQDIFPHLDINYREEISKKDFPFFDFNFEFNYWNKFNTKEEFVESIRLNELFRYCNGWAMAKYVKYLTDMVELDANPKKGPVISNDDPLDTYIKPELINRLIGIEAKINGMDEWTEIRLAAWVELLMDKKFFLPEFKKRNREAPKQFAILRYNRKFKTSFNPAQDAARKVHKDQLEHYFK